MKVRILISSFLLLCFIQISMLSGATEVYTYFSDNDVSLSDYFNQDYIDCEGEEGTDSEEEKEGEDTDEKEYHPILALQNDFTSNLSSFDIHYLQTSYAVTLHITVQPPKLV